MYASADHGLITKLYLRLARDSRYQCEPVQIACLIGDMLKISPLEVWLTLGWSNMCEIASGAHPACKQETV
jgi:hypothetical protein